MKSLSSPNVIRKRKARLYKKVLFVVIALVGLIFGPSLLSKNKYLQIKSINVSGDQVVSGTEVASLAAANISGNYLYLFSKSNSFIYPNKEISKSILKEFPRIKNLKIGLSGLDKLEIKMEERNEDSVWCGESDNQCFYLDEDGFAFSEAPQGIEDLYFLYKSEDKDGRILGTFPIEKEDFDKIVYLKKSLETLNFKPQEVVLDNYKDVHIYLLDGTKLIFNLNEDLTKSVSNFESVIGDEELAVFSHDKFKVDEIDLRFGNKVFYKRDSN